MRWWGAILALVLAGPWAGRAVAQSSSPVILVMETEGSQLSATRLRRSLTRALGRPVLRLTDARAQGARGRLTIAFSRPARWVLRYEASGSVAWVSDRIGVARRLLPRLTELSQDLVGRVEGDRASARARWADNESVILALQSEIIDPFENDPPRVRREPVTILWSEVVDPFASNGARPATARRRLPASTEVWSEVLDPWAGDPRPRRR